MSETHVLCCIGASELQNFLDAEEPLPVMSDIKSQVTEQKTVADQEESTPGCNELLVDKDKDTEEYPCGKDARGYVYLVTKPSFRGGVCKVGMSRSVDKRLKSYGKKSTVHCLFEVPDCVFMERQIISAFKEKFSLLEGKETFEGELGEMKKLFLAVCFDGENSKAIANIPKEEVFDCFVNYHRAKNRKNTKFSLEELKKDYSEWSLTKCRGTTFEKMLIYGRKKYPEVTIPQGSCVRAIKVQKEISIFSGTAPVEINTPIPPKPNYNERNDARIDFSNFYCSYCDMQSKSSSNFAKHRRTNKHITAVSGNLGKNEVKMYSCVACAFSSHKKRDYEGHLLTKKHKKNTTGEFLRYECLACGYDTENKGNFEKHTKTKRHEIKKFQNIFCDESFTLTFFKRLAKRVPKT